MSLYLPHVAVGKTKDQVVVNWLHPAEELAAFLLHTLDNGPFPESHPGFKLGPLVIFRSSQMEN